MKRVFCILLTILLLCSISACSTPADPEVTDETGVTAGSQSQQESTKNTETTQKEEENLVEFQLPRMELCCKVPEEYGRKANRRVAVATGYDEYIVTIFSGDAGVYSGDLEGIITYVAEDFTFDANKFFYPEIKAEELKASTTEKVVISGYEAVNFSGPITNTDGGTYQIYGFSMIIDEMPVMFLGILTSKDQAQEDLNAMKALVDQMAGSIFKR